MKGILCIKLGRVPLPREQGFIEQMKSYLTKFIAFTSPLFFETAFLSINSKVQPAAPKLIKTLEM